RIDSGIHNPERKAIGRYRILTTAGAAEPPTRLPIHKPTAQNGNTPSTLTRNSSNHWPGASETPARVTAMIASMTEIRLAKIIAMAIFATSSAAGGIGNARL